MGVRAPYFPQKWEPEYPIFEGSGNQGTLFDGSEGEVGIRVPYFSSGSGSQGTLFDGSKTYVQGNQLLYRRENIDLDHGIGHSSSLFGKLNVQVSDA